MAEEAVSKIDVSPLLMRQLDALMAYDKGLVDSQDDSTLPRPWYIPTGWETTPTDIPALGSAFDRQEINQEYIDAINDNGTAGDACATTIEADWMATAERAFRIRHTTGVRDNVHAMNRQRGHANPGGIYKGGVARYIQAILGAAKGGG